MAFAYSIRGRVKHVDGGSPDRSAAPIAPSRGPMSRSSFADIDTTATQVPSAFIRGCTERVRDSYMYSQLLIVGVGITGAK